MSVSIDTEKYRITPGAAVDLDSIDADDDGGLDERETDDHFDDLIDRLDKLQERLYAERKQSLLLVFQAMDCGGKDSTIRKVLGPLNPQGVRVWSFKKPTPVELEHDFLWRVHRRAPGDGYIGVFNRSHYEDVLIVRVKNFAPESVWSKRYEHINRFERLLADEGTTIVKFYLHITKEYQKKRLQRRLDRPEKHWKFNPDDLKERVVDGLSAGVRRRPVALLDGTRPVVHHSRPDALVPERARGADCRGDAGADGPAVPGADVRPGVDRNRVMRAAAARWNRAVNRPVSCQTCAAPRFSFSAIWGPSGPSF